jgi:hypothetical protein
LKSNDTPIKLLHEEVTVSTPFLLKDFCMFQGKKILLKQFPDCALLAAKPGGIPCSWHHPGCIEIFRSAIIGSRGSDIRCLHGLEQGSQIQMHIDARLITYMNENGSGHGAK